MDIHVYLHQTVKKGNESFQENNVFVVVNFLSQVIFIFPLFLGMVIYANEFETKKQQKSPEIKN